MCVKGSRESDGIDTKPNTLDTLQRGEACGSFASFSLSLSLFLPRTYAYYLGQANRWKSRFHPLSRDFTLARGRHPREKVNPKIAAARERFCARGHWRL